MHARFIFRISISVFLLGLSAPIQAQDLLHFIEAKDHARVLEYASGLDIADDGTVYVTSEEKGTLLKIVDGNIEALSLSPEVFQDIEVPSSARICRQIEDLLPSLSEKPQ